MSWDMDKDVERLDTLGAYGRCTCCGLAVEVLGDVEIQRAKNPLEKKRAKYPQLGPDGERPLQPVVVGIFQPDWSEVQEPDWSEVQESEDFYEALDEFRELSEIGMCGCFDDWDQEVVWFVEQRFRDEMDTWRLTALGSERRLLGQCRSCGRAVERQAPWHWRNPKRADLSSTPWLDALDTGTVTGSSPGSGSVETSGEAEPGVPFAYVYVTRWMSRDTLPWSTASVHSDSVHSQFGRHGGYTEKPDVEYYEAFARYVRLSDEQGACACYDDTEPQEAL